jgi:S1-C subfamily serine protease
MGVRTPTRAEQRAFGTEAGLYVAYVQNGSRADTIGVPNDVLLTRVGDRRIGSVEAARQALAALADRQAPTLLEVRRRDGTRAFYEVD